MKLLPVKEVPEVKRNHKLQDLIREFKNSDDRSVKIVFSDHDYKSPLVCYKCLWVAARDSGYKNIRVVKRGDEVYMVKV